MAAFNAEAASDHRFAALSAGSFPGAKRLDGEAVETITAFLFHRGGHGGPVRLAANAGKSFQGSIVLGMGFTFGDTDKKGVASPLAEMRRLIEDNPRNQEAIFPYISGEEVNTSPIHTHHRYVINFRDWPLRREDVGESWADADEKRRRELQRQPIVPHDYPEPVAADWPELLAIVAESRQLKTHVQSSTLASSSAHAGSGRLLWRSWTQRFRNEPEDVESSRFSLPSGSLTNKERR